MIFSLLLLLGFGQDKTDLYVTAGLGTFRLVPPANILTQYDDGSKKQIGEGFQNSFYIMEKEITVEQYCRICKGIFCGRDACEIQIDQKSPLHSISREDVSDFLSILNSREEVVYDLPTTRQQFAASASVLDNIGEWSADGEIYRLLNPLGWFGFNSGGSLWLGCGRQRNAYGLCDILGNVREWAKEVTYVREEDAEAVKICYAYGLTYVSNVSTAPLTKILGCYERFGDIGFRLIVSSL